MQRIKSLILWGMFILPICTLPATYRIDITPKGNNDTCEMKLNTQVTFKLSGYEKKESEATETEAVIDKLWWNFDKEILTKVGSSPDSITLRAVKSGVSSLSVIAMIRNQTCQKTITILVNKKMNKKRR